MSTTTDNLRSALAAIEERPADTSVAMLAWSDFALVAHASMGALLDVYDKAIVAVSDPAEANIAELAAALETVG